MSQPTLPIRVAFDMTLLQSRQGGSSTYATALLAALRARTDITMESIQAPDTGAFATARWMLSGARSRTVEVGASVLHCPAFLAPIRSSVPFVLTVHDLSLRLMPSGQSLEWRAYYDLVFPRLVRRAAAIVTPTDATRNDVIRFFGVSPDNIVTTPYGIENRFLIAERRNRAIDADQPVIVFPGPPIGRKNLDIVLHAMASAPAGSAVSRARLQISGAEADDFPHYRRQIEERSLEPRVQWLGRLAFDEIPGLYQRADVLVYPSFLEGFGFPPLEAMASGTPVVASNASCLPEVIGPGALLVDPNDLPGFTAAVESVLTNDSVRDRLVELGAARAKQFTWTRCAEMVAAVYTRVAAG